MSNNRAKGTAAETAVVNCLQAEGFPHVERRAGNGIKDRGDITGIPGLVVEVKNHKTMDLAEWIKEMERERLEDGAAIGIVWHKRRGRGSPLDWYVSMTGADLLQFLSVWAD